MTTRDTDWDGVRLHVVTGKGGTGKTTVSAALALALARAGRRGWQVSYDRRCSVIADGHRTHDFLPSGPARQPAAWS